MAYQLYDAEGMPINHHDLQDKAPWCVAGASTEQVFVQRFGAKLSLIINPDKAANKFAPDLFNKNVNRIGDLKTQNTPFFKSRELFGIDPQFAVTFNEKDRARYAVEYPEIEIYFWVDWIATRFKNAKEDIQVKPMQGVWFIDFSRLLEVIKRAHLHKYLQRVGDDKGNAKSSYVISLNEPEFTKLV